MELQSYLDKVKVTTMGDDDDDFDDGDDTGNDETDAGENDNTVNSIICPSCCEDLSITDEDELFEGAQLICGACGIEIAITGFEKDTPILKEIDEQK